MKFTLSTKQQLFLDKVKEGKNLFLTGKAGTGKSLIVTKAIEYLKSIDKNVIAIAPTGIAATNIGGATIHSTFSLRPFGVLDWEACNFVKGEKRKMFQLIDTIFIDEISMLRPDTLDAINLTLLKNGCKGLQCMQIVFVGDLKQLESPIDDNTRSVLYQKYDGVEFYHADIYKSLNPETIELDEILRQSDEDFIYNLNIIRDGGKSPYFRQFLTDTHTNGVILAPHKSTVHKYNLEGLNSVPGEDLTFKAVIIGNAKAHDFNVEETITVKHGCKIMYLANSKNNDLVNGTIGTFINKNGRYFIAVNGVEFALNKQKFHKHDYVLSEDKKRLELTEIGSIEQYPIKLAYALTIHKSQGLTFDEVTIDLSLNCFSKGQLYVALSRVTSPNGLSIIVNR